MGDSRNFRQLLEGQWAAGKFLCVGLDSDARIVEQVLAPQPTDERLQARFNQLIIDATAHLAGAFKPNSAFYEARGVDGIADLQETISYINQVAPGVPVILDAKRADIGSTNVGYVDFAFEYMKADAVTVHPYLGEEALRPFLDRADKGIFVLCRTSNPRSSEFQDLSIPFDRDSHFLFEVVAKNVAAQWNRNGNCGLVVGATYPEELARVRDLVGDLPILIPGIGTQGGDLEASLLAGLTSQGSGVLMNASRSIIFSSMGNDFVDAAKIEAIRLDRAIRDFRMRHGH